MDSILDYLFDRQQSRQWRGILTALAQEFETQLGTAELRQLMHRVGRRFGAAHPMPACTSLAELAQSLNLLWEGIDWGYVELSDAAESLRIVHHCPPLGIFGAAALAWTPALLEGAYQEWLSVLGADHLTVMQYSELDQHLALEFRLERAP